MDEPLDLNLLNYDYKIVTFVDSSNCTACSMKLARWKEISADLKTKDDVDVEIITIVRNQNPSEVISLLEQQNYLMPVAIDSTGIFMQANKLPADADLHTFLLDEDNRIVAIGNPSTNPKIKELYYDIIGQSAYCTSVDSPRLCVKPVKALGLMHPGQKVSNTFLLHNNSDKTMTIQSLSPSCDCVTVDTSSKTLAPGELANVTVTVSADSTSSAFRRFVNVYYNEKDNPERLTLYGYVKTK